MIVGVPREIKDREYRVAMVPAGVRDLVAGGHAVLVESGAGEGSGFSDEEYEAAGARLLPAPDVWEKAALVVKVKEPQPSEWEFLEPGKILFAFFHFASSRASTEAAIDSRATCIAYETVQTEDGRTVLLGPMSEIAGRLSVQEAAKFLERPMGGRGVLLGAVPGTAPANVLVLGGGNVGEQAAKVAAGMGARVTLFDIDLQRLRRLSDVLPSNVTFLVSTPENLRRELATADAVIGAVYRVGERAARLLTREDLGLLPKGCVLVDVCIDQGGCFETSRPTDHDDPVYEVDGILHYCVTNMPGCVPRSSTRALTNATLPYIRLLADLGFPDALRENAALRSGLNVHDGRVFHPAVARAFDFECDSLDSSIR